MDTDPAAVTRVPPVALCIGGHDPGGGAGEAAVLRTYAALGVHGTSALTVVTVQNTVQFRSVHPLPPDLVTAQVEAVLDDLPVAATTVGMLWAGDIAAAVGALAMAGRLPRLVVDPVLASGTGERIVDVQVDRCYREQLFGAAVLVTPNTVEAGLILGEPVRTVDETVDAARALQAFGPRAVIVTGGRRPGAEAVDVLAVGSSVELLRSPWVDTANVRGAGDTLAAAVTAGWLEARAWWKRCEPATLSPPVPSEPERPRRLGAGRGPVDQLGA